jgi:hypothetical protein
MDMAYIFSGFLLVFVARIICPVFILIFHSLAAGEDGWMREGG